MSDEEKEIESHINPVKEKNEPRGGRGRSFAARAGITADKIRELYEVQGLTDKQIGARYGASDVAVSNFRRRNGILTKSQLQRLQPDRERRLDDLTEVQYIELCASKSDGAIAKEFGVSKFAVRRKRNLFGIPAISKTERCTSIEDLTTVQKEAVIGVLLGDGHLLSRGVLKVSHSHTQLGYLRHLHSILTSIARPIWYDDGVKRDSHDMHFEFGFSTEPHVWLKSLRSLFYPIGKRIFPDSILRELAPRSLAYWYFDDGHLGDNLPRFALGDISREEALKVAKLIGEHFSLETYIRAESGDPPSCRILRIRATSTDLFFYLIREFAIPDMLYKLPRKHWPEGVIPCVPPKTQGEVRLPFDLNKRCRSWSDLSEDDQGILLEDVVKFWEASGFPHPNPRPEELHVLSNVETDHVIQEGIIKARQVGQTTCNAFSQHIWEGFSYGSKSSPAEIFADPELLRKCLRFLLDKAKEVPTASRVRSALRLWRRSGVYNFRPSAAKALTDQFCRPNGVVFDPCGGYGGRLMGVLMSKARPTYIACEPNTKSFDSLLQLHQWMATYLEGLKDKCRIVCSPAEEYDFPHADLILTSPPYWKREVYSVEETQSAVRYTTYEQWLKCFWGEILKKGSKALRPGGWFVLNVDDFSLSGSNYTLVQDTIDIMKSLGFSDPSKKLKYQLPGTDNCEWVLCWHQGELLPTKTEDLPPIKLDMASCRKCGGMKPLSQLRGGTCFMCLAPQGISKVCKGCSEGFVANRKDQDFCTENCYARYRRKEYRKLHPAKTKREFTCKECGKKWKTKAKGNFRFCPSCKDARDLQGRKKVCQYSHCGEAFVDTSPKNTMQYCCPEHRRREKLFRSGVAKDESYFKENKPQPTCKCRVCGKPWYREPGGKRSNRCPTCIEAARHKSCSKCSTHFRDASDKNTRKFCDQCK
jgi:hypothetical protein